MCCVNPVQECWEMLFDTVDTAHDVIRIATGVMSTLKLRPEKMLASECVRDFLLPGDKKLY